MQKILILGAGRSTSALISSLLDQAISNNWFVTVGDIDKSLALEKVNGHANGKAIKFDINSAGCDEIIKVSNLVISMLSASFHFKVAKICSQHGINMLTPSYVTPEIQALSKDFKEKKAGLVMEMGLDPGIDHMSAMHVLDRIKEKGNKLLSFESFTGGLLAPNTRDNPWDYKFTWNPRNVVMAGQGNVKFIQEGAYKYIPYQKLFNRTEIIHIPGHGYFEGYANRDSLKYLEAYKLQGINTLYRGTLRRPGFCKAWNVFVQLGTTDDTYKLEGVESMTHRQFINSFLSYNPHDSVELKLAHYMNLELDSEIMYKLKWLGIFDNEVIGLTEGTPAQILEHILKKKWTIQKDEKDMIVMWHKFKFLQNNKEKEIQSHMVLEGKDAVNTAMSMTVGLPLAVTAKLILKGQLNLRGINIPTEASIYEPVMRELETHGIRFVEDEKEVSA